MLPIAVSAMPLQTFPAVQAADAADSFSRLSRDEQLQWLSIFMAIQSPTDIKLIQHHATHCVSNPGLNWMNEDEGNEMRGHLRTAFLSLSHLRRLLISPYNLDEFASVISVLSSSARDFATDAQRLQLRHVLLHPLTELVSDTRHALLFSHDLQLRWIRILMQHRKAGSARL